MKTKASGKARRAAHILVKQLVSNIFASSEMDKTKALTKDVFEISFDSERKALRFQ